MPEDRKPKLFLSVGGTAEALAEGRITQVDLEDPPPLFFYLGDLDALLRRKEVEDLPQALFLALVKALSKARQEGRLQWVPAIPYPTVGIGHQLLNTLLRNNEFPEIPRPDTFDLEIWITTVTEACKGIGFDPVT
ncbi:MAG: hypothetical protein C5B53_13635 [Candidatus Melainabacteria bacterium]|nr:MAG: hypothetical protein C5B53_13635 [Candidatus Melainabacteria bacterium]